MEQIREKYSTNIKLDFELNEELYNDLENAIPKKTSVTNLSYDANKIYVPRAMRREWTPVSLLGKVLVRDNGECKPGQKCDCLNGIAVPGSTWLVLNRTAANIIKVLYK